MPKKKAYAVSAATAVLLASSIVVPGAVVEAAETTNVENGFYFGGNAGVFFTIEGLGLKSDEELTKLIQSAGGPGNIFAVVNGKYAKIADVIESGKDFTEIAKPTDPTIFEGNEFKKEDGTIIQNPFKTTFEVTNIASITKTGVSVTFPSLTKDVDNATVVVTNPAGSVVAVKAQNLKAGATQATFEFATALDTVAEGKWFVNGKEFTVQPAAAVKVESVSAINETTIEVTLAEALAEGTELTAEDFTVLLGEETIAVSNVAVEGTKVTLTVDLAEKAGVLTVNTIAAVEEVNFVTPDNESPVITVDSEASVEVIFGSEFTLPEVAVTDNKDENLTATLVITNTSNEEVEAIDTRVADTYTLTYTAVDAAGNEAATEVITVEVLAPSVVAAFTSTTTSKATVVTYPTVEGLTAENFTVTFLAEDAPSTAEPTELTNVTVTEDEDAPGTYVVTFENLNGKKGDLEINGQAETVDYTTTGLAAAVADVATKATAAKAAIDADTVTTELTALETALAKAVLNYDELVVSTLTDEYAAEIAGSITNTYERLTAAIERVNAEVLVTQAELLKDINAISTATAEQEVLDLLTTAKATLLTGVTGVDYFDAIEGTQFASLEEVVETIDAVNKSIVQAEVKAAEDFVKTVPFLVTGADTLVTDAESLVGVYATAYDLETIETNLVEGDSTEAVDYLARLATVDTKIALEAARQDVIVLSGKTLPLDTVVIGSGSTPAAIQDALKALTGIDATTVKADVTATDYTDAYKAEIIKLNERATVANIQTAVNKANEIVKANTAATAITAVFAEVSVSSATPPVVTGTAELATKITAVVSEDTVVKADNKDAYAIELNKIAAADRAKTTATQIATIVNKVNAEVTKGLVADVLTAAKVNPFVAQSLVSTGLAGTGTLELLVADIDGLATAGEEVFTSDLLVANEAAYATALAKLQATATTADIAAVVYEVNTVADFNAKVTAASAPSASATELTALRSAISEVTLANGAETYTNLPGAAKDDIAELVVANAPKTEAGAINFTSVAQILEVVATQVAAQPALVAEVNNAQTISQVITVLNKVSPEFKALTTATEKETIAEEFLTILKGDATANPVVAPKTFVSLAEVRTAVTGLLTP